jgi:ubiquitin-protein ligase
MRSSRLMREYAEIKKCPLANITVFPLNEENLSEWHGNIRGAEDSDFDGIVVHFVITFPALYPMQPPRIRICSFIPHLNVQMRQGNWEVCLDMLESAQAGAVTIPYQNWSSAFSVQSILIQLSSFLLAEGQPTQVIIVLALVVWLNDCIMINTLFRYLPAASTVLFSRAPPLSASIVVIAADRMCLPSPLQPRCYPPPSPSLLWRSVAKLPKLSRRRYTRAG